VLPDTGFDETACDDAAFEDAELMDAALTGVGTGQEAGKKTG
jgi:hypothetical protein